MLFVCLYLMFSRFGSIRLGDDDSRPEFSNFSWFAMLFSAGVGIGLLFFSIAEPIFYFDNTAPWGYPNNPFADRDGGTGMDIQRAIMAMRVIPGSHGSTFQRASTLTTTTGGVRSTSILQHTVPGRS